jgi:hypothetical protein
MLIGLTGLAGSGKSSSPTSSPKSLALSASSSRTAAQEHDPHLLRDMGHCEDDVERMIEGDLKERRSSRSWASPRATSWSHSARNGAGMRSGRTFGCGFGPPRGREARGGG